MRLNTSVFSRTFFMMLDDIGSSGTSCSKLIMRKAKPRTVPPQRGSFFYVGNKNENSALIKLETVNTSPHGYNRQALRLSVRIEVVGLGHRKDCLNA